MRFRVGVQGWVHLAGREERGLRGELGAPLALLLRLPPPLPGAQRLA